MNSLFNSLYGVPKVAPNIQNMINLIKVAKNPTAYLQNVMSKNPQLQQLIQQSGGNPKTAFYNLAKQKGVNPDDIINMLK